MSRPTTSFIALLFACTPAPAPPDAGVNVTLRDDPGADWACTSPFSCTADYLALPGLAADAGTPITEAELDAELKGLDDHTVPLVAGPLDSGDLEARIVAALNIGFLRDGLDERPLTVSTTARSSPDGGYRQEDLLFQDPYVGKFKAALLLPASGDGPFPAVVAFPGHGDDPTSYRDVLGGGNFPSAGLALLIIGPRAMNIDADEHQVAHDLLRAGFTLMGLRTYEALLALKYLRARPDRFGLRYGLIGHSGGSSTGNLLVRFEPRFAAYVSDHTVDWHSSGVGEPWHCETLPALYPLGALINDFSTSPRPTRSVGYGYPEGLPPLFAFFNHYLAAP